MNAAQFDLSFGIIKINIMNIRKSLLICAIALFATTSWSQGTQDKELDKRCFIETQAFMILTPILDPSPEFLQLNLGYKISQKDEVAVEFITWAYTGPLGRQLGPDYENPESGYDGDAKSLGMGLAYKRYIWKGAYARVHATAFRQTYRDANKEKIQTGFMLFNTVRLGYNFNFLNERFFISPSMGMTFWPVLTNLPDSFQAQEDNFPSYFLGEVGLHVGFNF